MQRFQRPPQDVWLTTAAAAAAVAAGNSYITARAYFTRGETSERKKCKYNNNVFHVTNSHKNLPHK
jgi:hypothetical protein